MPHPRMGDGRIQDASLTSSRMNGEVNESHGNELPRGEDNQTASDKPSGPAIAPIDPFLGSAGLNEDDLALLRSWDDEELDRLDLEAAEKEVEADELTHGQVFLERLQHLFYTTMWFVVFAAVACGLDLLAPGIRKLGVSDQTQKPLEYGAHLLMYADLLLLTVQLLETIGVQAIRAGRKVLKEVTS